MTINVWTQCVDPAPQPAQPAQKCECPSGAAMECMSLKNCRLNTSPPQRQPLTLEQADAIQRMPDVRQYLVAYAKNPNDTLACYVVKAIAVGIGAKP